MILARGISGHAQRPPMVRPLLLFSLFFRELTASEVSFSAEILGFRRSSEPKNSKALAVFAVSRCFCVDRKNRNETEDGQHHLSIEPREPYFPGRENHIFTYYHKNFVLSI